MRYPLFRLNVFRKFKMSPALYFDHRLENGRVYAFRFRIVNLSNKQFHNPLNVGIVSNPKEWIRQTQGDWSDYVPIRQHQIQINKYYWQNKLGLFEVVLKVRDGECLMEVYNSTSYPFEAIKYLRKTAVLAPDVKENKYFAFLAFDKLKCGNDCEYEGEHRSANCSLKHIDVYP